MMSTDSKAIWIAMSAVGIMTIMGAFLLVMHVISDDSEQDVVGHYKGEWMDGYHFEAEVTVETIRVDLDMDGMSGLYWLGDFSFEDGTVYSAADTTALNHSLLGSGLLSKEFHYSNDELSFDFSILGVDQVITMEKVN